MKLMEEMGEFCKGKNNQILFPVLLEVAVISLKSLKDKLGSDKISAQKNIVGAFVNEVLKIV